MFFRSGPDGVTTRSLALRALVANYVDPPNARPNAITVASKGYQNALRFPSHVDSKRVDAC
jgi:hypothetical protein